MTFVPLAYALATLILATPSPSAAGDTAAPKELGGAGGWKAYTLPEGKSQICYVVGKPAADPKGKRKANLLVTHRPAEKATNVVSIVMGTDLPPSGRADVTLGKQKFDFFTKEQTAWARDSETDKATVTAMLKARELDVKVKPAKGPELDDSYPLDGFSQALDLIDKACKVKR